MNRYLKRIVIGAFLVPFVCFSYILGLIYFYDPLQLFGEKYPEYYYNEDGNVRLSLFRIIENYDFDSVILGDSSAIGFTPKDFVNGRYINISSKDLHMFEKIYLFSYTIKHKQINNIVSSLNGSWDLDGNEHTKKYRHYMGIYASSFFIRFKSYFDGLIPWRCFVLISKNEECIGNNKHDYYNILYDYNTKLTEEYYMVNDNEFNISSIKLNRFIGYNQSLIDEFVVFLKNNKEVKFHFYIPPFSTLYYSTKEDTLLYVNQLKEVLNKIYLLDNVKVYFFGNEQFTDNMHNYIHDRFHYLKWINSRIAKAINEGTNIISIDNMEEEFNKFIKKVENYDIKAYEEALSLDIRE